MYVYMYVCMYIRMYACMCVCMCVCVCVCVYIYIWRTSGRGPPAAAAAAAAADEGAQRSDLFDERFLVLNCMHELVTDLPGHLIHMPARSPPPC